MDISCPKCSEKIKVNKTDFYHCCKNCEDIIIEIKNGNIINTQNRFSIWQGWINDIYNRVKDLKINFHLFDEVNKIIKSRFSKKELNHYFFRLLYTSVKIYLMIGIRKELKPPWSPDKIKEIGGYRERSMSNLMLDLYRYSKFHDGNLLSKERFEKRRKLPKIANFNIHAFLNNDNYLQHKKIESDYLNLKENCKDLVTLVDKRVTHIDFKVGKIDEFGISTALDALIKIASDYRNFLNTTFPVNVNDDINYYLSSNWKNIFKVPWI